MNTLIVWNVEVRLPNQFLIVFQRVRVVSHRDLVLVVHELKMRLKVVKAVEAERRLDMADLCSQFTLEMLSEVVCDT